MSETLKFGAGEWATKKGSTLAYNSENGNFKPLPFTFDRSTSATRVNKEGLIEVVSNNEPRIDFLNDSDGALLLEPLRNNYIPYSTLDFNGGSKPEGWSIGFGTGTYSYEQLTYKGQKAVKQTQITTGRSYLDTGTISVLANTEHTLKIQFILDECVADANDDIVTFLGFGVDAVYRFSDVDENGVLEIQYNPLSDNVGNLRIGLGCNGNEDGGKSLAWAIPQLEQGSYATSYIPTQGSIGTRDAESCSDAGNDQVFNDSEGVLFAEISALDENAGTERYVYIGNGTTANRVVIRYSTTENDIRMLVTSGGSTQVSSGTTNYNITENHKIALKYKVNDFALWIDGVEVLTDTNGSTPTGINQLTLSYSGTQLYGNTKQIKYFNTALSDAELAALTKI